MTSGEPTLVAVGRIGKAHGLRGEVSIDAWTDDPQDRFAPGSVLSAEPPAGGDRMSVTVATAREHAGRWLVGLVGVTDRSAAEALRGTRLLLPARDRPAIEDPDEFYDTDLIGLRAEAPDGTVLGRVSDVVHGPVGDYLAVVIEARAGAEASADREHLVPFVSQIVPRVDPDGGRVVIDAPDGLFDL